jgi:hypothetical protein
VSGDVALKTVGAGDGSDAHYNLLRRQIEF